MRALILSLLMTAPALANAPGCYEQNASGDRFIFTSDSAIMVYEPSTGIPSPCSVGIDGNGDTTIICTSARINSTVEAASGHQVLINGQLWSYFCPVPIMRYVPHGV